MTEFRIRDATKDDESFVYATWLNNARAQGDRKHMTNTVYFTGEQKRITDIMARSTVTVICDSNDEGHIYGWICHKLLGDIFIIHYAYMKNAFRGLGIMTQVVTALYPEFRKEEVATTYINGLVLLKRDKYSLKFNPYLLERMK